jgi:hypothetical protein
MLRANPRLQILSQLARADAEGDILATIYMRNITKRRKISKEYVSKTVKFYFRRQREDPHVARLRRLADERQQKGLPTDESLVAMNRPAITEPVDDLIKEEDDQLTKVRLQRVQKEMKKIGARPRAVINRFLSDKRLTQAERCVYHRTVSTLRAWIMNKV